jgi:hypothetical protein
VTVAVFELGIFSWGGCELSQQGLDASVDLFDDVADRFHRLTGRIVELPLDVALARVERAGITAAHGDDDVDGLCEVIAEELGEFVARIKAPFTQDCYDGGVELGGRLGPGREDFDSALRVVVEQDASSNTAPGVVGAQKEYDGFVVHLDSSGSIRSADAKAAEGAACSIVTAAVSASG